MEISRRGERIWKSTLIIGMVLGCFRVVVFAFRKEDFVGMKTSELDRLMRQPISKTKADKVINAGGKKMKGKKTDSKICEISDRYKRSRKAKQAKNSKKHRSYVELSSDTSEEMPNAFNEDAVDISKPRNNLGFAGNFPYKTGKDRSKRLNQKVSRWNDRKIVDAMHETGDLLSDPNDSGPGGINVASRGSDGKPNVIRSEDGTSRGGGRAVDLASMVKGKRNLVPLDIQRHIDAMEDDMKSNKRKGRRS
ncbi:hypothetical protein AAMO2058_000143800 [Amorphochlora amoebiformis]